MYRDANGNEWQDAQSALDDFVADLPYLTEAEAEEVFQFTLWSAGADFNLRAIAHGVTYSGLDGRFEGDNYPVPYRVEAD